MPEQPRISVIASTQPSPPGRAAREMFRRLRDTPVPHLEEQGDQWPQFESSQSIGLCAKQGAALQGLASARLPPSHWPPCLGGRSNVRLRKVWPLPQLLSHAVQSPHVENLHASGSSTGAQPSVSRTGSLHGAPSPFAGCATSRLRYLWKGLSKLQPAHSVQSPMTQGSAPPQGCVPHGRVLRKDPRQGFPPGAACWTMRRIWACQPPPHEALQSVQDPHSERAQSTGEVSLQGEVSLVPPSHSLPSP
mmetsp:Transcript_34242/g.108826  ORF Transcript_34242/g.108826 Transcript_34242/m.108826 type:complete len:248 (-) Transcript_34242:527-1270(-)